MIKKLIKLVKELMEKKLLICVLWVGSRTLSIKYILFCRKVVSCVAIIGILDILILLCNEDGWLGNYGVIFDNCILKYPADFINYIASNAIRLVKNFFHYDDVTKYKMVSSLFVWYGSILFFVLRIQTSISQASVKISNWGVKTGLLVLVVLCFSSDFVIPLIFDICFVVAILAFLVGAYGIFVRINPQNLFDHVLEQAFIERKVIYLFVNKIGKGILPEYFKDRLIHTTTSVYQCLVFIVEKGMMNVYDGCSEKWHKEGLVFNDTDFRQFLKFSFCEALEYYKVSLHGQVLLVKALYSKDNYEAGNCATEKLLNLYPTWSFLENKRQDVQKVYLVSLVEIALILKNKGILPKVVLNKLQDLELVSTFSDGLIMVYRTLFMKAIMDNDVTFVVEASYSVVSALQRYGGDQSSIILRKNELINDSKKFYGKFLYVLLSSAIKGIELGRSDIVSFMIKYCVSHFDTETFNNVLKKIKTYKCQDKKFDNDTVGNAFGMSSFDIDVGNARYYLSKLVILLYGQQLFMQTHITTICEKPLKLICLDDYVDEGWEYIFEKLFTEKYKLLWISYQNLDEQCSDCNSFKKCLKNNLLKVMNNKNEDEFESWTTWIVDNMSC